MEVHGTITEARAACRRARAAGRVVGIVPTMGALHGGHEALIRRAVEECGHVVVSIFVNPLQFGPREDFSAYPRTREADLAVCEAHGVHQVFAPSEREMYPLGLPLTTVSVRGLTSSLCGPHRPGHFDGVTTVVAKLFMVCEPDRAYFGEKDYQQYVVIRRMVKDLDMPVEVIPCATVRDADGLALSSRNVKLGPDERSQALCLSRGLLAAEQAFLAGQRDGRRLVAIVRSALAGAPMAQVDYIEIVDAEDLLPVETVARDAVIAVAARFPSARLIDNVVLRVPVTPADDQAAASCRRPMPA